MTLTASGGASLQATKAASLEPGTKRAALVLSHAVAGLSARDLRTRRLSEGFSDAAESWGYASKVFAASDIERAKRRIATGHFELVVVSAGSSASVLARLAPSVPGTRFVFADASLSGLGIEGLANATAFVYADDQSAELAGYISGLVGLRRGAPGEHPDVVSVVSGVRTPHTERIAAGFARGARRAASGVRVLVDYADSADEKTACEQIANEQVDSGADVVFGFGGSCGQAALAVVRARGVWGIRADEDAVPLGPHILATTWKQWEASPIQAFNRLEHDRRQLGDELLLRGQDISIGLDANYAVGIDSDGAGVSDSIWSKVVRLCSDIRQHTREAAP
jgi:basic membrane protein A